MKIDLEAHIQAGGNCDALGGFAIPLTVHLVAGDPSSAPRNVPLVPVIPFGNGTMDLGSVHLRRFTGK